jgi:hypothetical protein
MVGQSPMERPAGEPTKVPSSEGRTLDDFAPVLTTLATGP